VLLFTYLESTAGFAVRSFANSIALSTERNTQWSTSTTSTPDFFSFLLSLFYETSQLTALFGIYPGPYRFADVEDLICNTLGGAAGWQIAG
jgi:glycopeptide antibiotics resistance protein